jgi:hypothetical protein
MSGLLRTCGLVLVALTPLTLAACLSAEAARRELDHEVFIYHRDLRWQRCGQAATKLAPELREVFTAHCGDLEGRLNIEGIEILDVKVDEEEDTAKLRVRFTYVAAPSLTLDKVVVTERWAREEGKWRLVEGLWPTPQEAAP